MVASSVQLNAGKVGLCDLTPHSGFVVEALSKKGSVVETPTLGCPR